MTHVIVLIVNQLLCQREMLVELVWDKVREWEALLDHLPLQTAELELYNNSIVIVLQDCDRATAERKHHGEEGNKLLNPLNPSFTHHST